MGPAHQLPGRGQSTCSVARRTDADVRFRGPETFAAPGEIYVKTLPDGEPVQLTRDGMKKMSPVFSPDGSRIAYTVVAHGDYVWDTWVVPLIKGEPRLWLANASGLVWLDPRRILFSEVRQDIHMGIVTADENRAGNHGVYLPAGRRGMAHRSYPSPDRKWAVVVEMDRRKLAPLPPGSGRRQFTRQSSWSAERCVHFRGMVARRKVDISELQCRWRLPYLAPALPGRCAGTSHVRPHRRGRHRDHVGRPFVDHLRGTAPERGPGSWSRR